jgi:hypothetical protein
MTELCRNRDGCFIEIKSPWFHVFQYCEIGFGELKNFEPNHCLAFDSQFFAFLNFFFLLYIYSTKMDR